MVHEFSEKEHRSHPIEPQFEKKEKASLKESKWLIDLDNTCMEIICLNVFINATLIKTLICWD